MGALTSNLLEIVLFKIDNTIKNKVITVPISMNVKQLKQYIINENIINANINDIKIVYNNQYMNDASIIYDICGYWPMMDVKIIKIVSLIFKTKYDKC